MRSAHWRRARDPAHHRRAAAARPRRGERRDCHRRRDRFAAHRPRRAVRRARRRRRISRGSPRARRRGDARPGRRLARWPPSRLPTEATPRRGVTGSMEDLDGDTSRRSAPCADVGEEGHNNEIGCLTLTRGARHRGAVAEMGMRGGRSALARSQPARVIASARHLERPARLSAWPGESRAHALPGACAGASGEPLCPWPGHPPPAPDVEVRAGPQRRSAVLLHRAAPGGECGGGTDGGTRARPGAVRVPFPRWRCGAAAGGGLLINDAYNANPPMRAALGICERATAGTVASARWQPGVPRGRFRRGRRIAGAVRS